MPTTTTPRALRHGTLLATLLATAGLVLAGALAATSAKAEPHPDREDDGLKSGYTHKMKADAAGHWTLRRGVMPLENFVQEDDWVRMICQEYEGKDDKGPLWSLVKKGRLTLFVRDRLVDTDTNGRAPGIGDCKRKHLKYVTKPQLENDRGSTYG